MTPYASIGAVSTAAASDSLSVNALDLTLKECNLSRLSEGVPDAPSESWQERRRTIELAATGLDSFAEKVGDALYAYAKMAELLDYSGEYAQADGLLYPIRNGVEQFVTNLAESRRGGPRTNKERTVAKAWVWSLLQIGMCDFRKYRFADARRLFRCCEKAVVQHIAVSGYHADGTMARINFCIGLIHQDLFEYEEAKKRFLASGGKGWDSVRRAGARDRAARAYTAGPGSDGDSKTAGERVQSSKWMDLSVSQVLGLGLGAVHLGEGRPDLALPLLVAAKCSLSRIEENTVSRLVEVLYNDVQLALSGDNEDVVDESITQLENCFRSFTDGSNAHPAYAARTAHSLARAYTLLARPVESRALTGRGEQNLGVAESYVQHMERFAEARDLRVRCQALICRSLIERKRDRYPEAEAQATLAIEEAASFFEPLRLEALICRAEARLLQRKYEDALEDLGEAGEGARRQPRLRAICVLLRAQIFAITEESRAAEACIAEWERMRAGVTDVHVLKLERETYALMRSVPQEFVVRKNDPTLDPQEHERRLHAFLAACAISRCRTEKEAADLLGVSRQTLLNWKTAKPRPANAAI